MQTQGFFKRDRTFRQPIIWVTTFFMLVFHAGAVIALFLFSWKALLLAHCCGGWPVASASEWATIVSSPIVAIRLPNGWSGFFLCAVRWPWKAARFFGWQPTACITRTPIKRETRILLMTAVSGLTWAGFSPARRCKTIKQSCCPSFPSFAKTASKNGSAGGIGCRSQYWPFCSSP